MCPLGWITDAVGSVAITAGPGTTDWLYAPSPAPTIAGTPDPTLYQTERAGASFTYTFTGLNPGFYTVTLDFAEIFYTTYPDAGIRIFDVSINGEPSSPTSTSVPRSARLMLTHRLSPTSRPATAKLLCNSAALATAPTLTPKLMHSH